MSLSLVLEHLCDWPGWQWSLFKSTGIRWSSHCVSNPPSHDSITSCQDSFHFLRKHPLPLSPRGWTRRVLELCLLLLHVPSGISFVPYYSITRNRWVASCVLLFPTALPIQSSFPHSLSSSAIDCVSQGGVF